MECLVCYGGGGVILTLVGIYTYFKLTTGVCKSKADLSGKVVIVTGANAGIGYEAAKDLARRNAHVILACRSKQKAESALSTIIKETGNSKVEVMTLDVSSLASVRSFVAEFKSKFNQLNILVNNAGIGSQSGYHQTEDGLERVFATNHLGPFLLTVLLLDLLKKSGRSRVVNTASLLHAQGRITFDNLNCEKFDDHRGWKRQYANTKLMNVLFTRELAKRLQGTGVTTNCLHPGAVRTKIFEGIKPWMQVVLNIIWVFFKTPEEGAQTTIYLAVSEEVENVSGKYFSDCKEKTPAAVAQDDGVAKKLWEVSEKLAGV